VVFRPQIFTDEKVTFVSSHAVSVPVVVMWQLTAVHRRDQPGVIRSGVPQVWNAPMDALDNVARCFILIAHMNSTPQEYQHMSIIANRCIPTALPEHSVPTAKPFRR